jgi:alanyl-tRNA synthetase
MKLVTNAFKLADTHGVPLPMTLAAAAARGAAVSMPHFYRDALLAGWKSSRALAKIEEALLDAGCTRDYIDERLKWLEETGGKLLPAESAA